MVIANRPFPLLPSSFIYPPVPPGVPVVVVSLCPGRHLYSLCPRRHLCPGVPVCDFYLSVPGVIYIRQDIVGHRSIDEFKQFLSTDCFAYKEYYLEVRTDHRPQRLPLC
jgi:hypothetical protein